MVNQGKGLQVNSRCFISFSIGKHYYDELWCDIIPMDACHLLLGRPWLFDRKVMHDGYLNTYTFHKDGRPYPVIFENLFRLAKISRILSLNSKTAIFLERIFLENIMGDLRK